MKLIFLITSLIFSLVLVPDEGFAAKKRLRRKKRIQKVSPVSTESKAPPVDMPEGRPLTRGMYIASGLVGSLGGWGVGHAMQGRWKEKGWIFTIGETASLGVYVYGLQQWANCWAQGTEYDSDGEEEEPSDCSQYQNYVIGGLAGILLFHVWEVIDIWTVPKWKNGTYYVESKPGLILAPSATLVNKKITPLLSLNINL